ncbi:MAG: flavodoxin family protein [Alistipes indistinctus]
MKKDKLRSTAARARKWSTAALLQNALDGSASAGAEVEMIDLYKLDFKGCISCFGCKRKGAKVETCIVKDALQPVLQRLREADGIILGSPIYFANVTGAMRSFLERFLFPYRPYDKTPSPFPKQIPTAYIYTMNAPAFALGLLGYRKQFKYYRKLLKFVTGGPVRNTHLDRNAPVR